MNCKKCGFYINDKNQKFCGNCGEKTEGITTVSNQNNVNIDQKGQTFLIIGIVLAFCCSLPFGVAVILINELKYKPQLREENTIEAEKTKKLMIVLICIGLIFGVLVSGLSFFLELLAAFE